MMAARDGALGPESVSAAQGVLQPRLGGGKEKGVLWASRRREGLALG